MANGKDRNLQKQQASLQIARHFQGPLPPPELLGKYNEVLPGCADRIVKMAEEEQRHRHKIERFALRSNALAEYGGIAIAAVIYIGVVIGGFWLITQGYPAPGISAVIAALLAPIGGFLYIRRKQAN